MHFSVLVLTTWAAVALLSPLADLQPNQVALSLILAPPGPQLLPGADDLGRPVLDRLLAGTLGPGLNNLILALVAVG